MQFINSTEKIINQVVGSFLVQCAMQKHERFFFKLCNFYETENPNVICKNINEMFINVKQLPYHCSEYHFLDYFLCY
jgi:hypothetical protein